MANYNKVILIGNLTRDPQLSYLPSQTPVVELGVATNRRWRGQDGEMREDTCFVDCRAYGRQAETINQYMRKGRPILIEGRLQYNQWEAQDGSKRSKLRVVVENFQFLGGRGDSDGGGGYGASDSRPQQRAPQQQRPAERSYDSGPDEEPIPPEYDDGGGSEDIPF